MQPVALPTQQNSKKRKLDDGTADSTSHTHIVVGGEEHAEARKLVAEGEEVLNSQSHENNKKIFSYEGSNYVITGPNKQVLVEYNPAQPGEFWNEVTDQNFITAHLEHHPMKMDTFVQDINKVYVLLTKDDAKGILKRVLGTKRIPYAQAVKVNNRDVKGACVYAVVPPVLYNEYVIKQKKTANRLIGSGGGGGGKSTTPVEETATAPPSTSLGQQAKRGGRGQTRRGGGTRNRGTGRRGSTAAVVATNTEPMDTGGDSKTAKPVESKQGKKATGSPAASRYPALALSPVRPATAPAAAVAVPKPVNVPATNSVSTTTAAAAAATDNKELSESQAQTIGNVNGLNKNLQELLSKLAGALIERSKDSYLRDAVAQYHQLWGPKCTSYTQLKMNMATREEKLVAMNGSYSLMDDLLWLYILTSPQLVRKLRHRVTEVRDPTPTAAALA